MRSIKRSWLSIVLILALMVALGMVYATVQVRDSQGQTAQRQLSLSVQAAAFVSGTITAQVSPMPAEVGQQVTFQGTVRNTGTARHTFVAGLSVWKVGTSINDALISTSQPVTLDPCQQQIVVLRTYSFSSGQTGDWNYQLGLWRDNAGGTLLGTDPAPAGVLRVTAAQGVAPMVTGVSQAHPKVQPTRLWLTVWGGGFVSGSQVVLRIGGRTVAIPGDRTQFVSSTQIKVYVGFTAAGPWSAQVVNPSGLSSNIFSFRAVP